MSVARLGEIATLLKQQCAIAPEILGPIHFFAGK